MNNNFKVNVQKENPKTINLNMGEAIYVTSNNEIYLLYRAQTLESETKYFLTNIRSGFVSQFQKMPINISPFLGTITITQE